MTTQMLRKHHILSTILVIAGLATSALAGSTCVCFNRWVASVPFNCVEGGTICYWNYATTCGDLANCGTECTVQKTRELKCKSGSLYLDTYCTNDCGPDGECCFEICRGGTVTTSSTETGTFYGYGVTCDLTF